MGSRQEPVNSAEISSLITQLKHTKRYVELKSEHKSDVMRFTQPEVANERCRSKVRKASAAKADESVKHMDFQELERRRISRELHDGLGQILTNIKLRMQQCFMELENTGKAEMLGDTWETMEEIPSMVSEAIQEVRSICSALRPAMLDDLGLLAAISWQCRQCRDTLPRLKTEVDFFLEEPEIPESFKTNLYRITQEALNNAVKYSNADVIRVGMRKEQGILYLNIEDNGEGFEHFETRANARDKGVTGFGLTSMRERAEALGGTLIIESNKNIGTNVQVALPLPSDM